MIRGTFLLLVVLLVLLVEVGICGGQDEGKAAFLDLRRTIGRGEYGRAMARCQELIQRYPKGPALYETLAEVAQYANRLEDAFRFLEGRVEEGTQMGLAYFGLGSVVSFRGDDRLAVRYFSRAIELGVTVPELYKAFEYSYERLEGVEAALRLFTSLCHRYPDNAGYWYAAGLAYWSKADFARSRREMEQATNRFPGERRYEQASRVLKLRLVYDSFDLRILELMLAEADSVMDFAGGALVRSHLVRHFVRAKLHSKAKSLCAQLIRASESSGYLRWVGWGNLELAEILSVEGDYRGALTYVLKSLKASSSYRDSQLLQYALGRQFDILLESGDFDNALRSASHRLILCQDLSDKRGYTLTLNDLARVHHALQDQELALIYAIEALIQAETNQADKMTLCRIHVTLGLVYEALRDFESALHHYALAGEMNSHGDADDRIRAIVHGNVGNTYRHLGKRRLALANLRAQLRLSQQMEFTREEIYALINLGEYYFDAGDYESSGVKFQEALQKARRMEHKPTITSCLMGVARNALKLHKIDQALLLCREVLSHSFHSVSSLSLAHSRSPLVDNTEYIEELVCSIVQKGKPRDALELLEAFRSRIILPDPRIARFMLTADSLMRGEISTSLRLRSQLNLRMRRISPDSDRLPPVELSARAVEELREAADIEIKYQGMVDSLERTIPAMTRVWQPAQDIVTSLQRQFLGPDQAILEYVIGDLDSYVFCMRHDTLSCRRLAITKGTLAQLLDALSAVTRGGISRDLVWNSALARFDDVACALAYDLLMRPIEADLKGIKKLIVVPGGDLWWLPFEALVIRESSQSAENVGFGDAHFLIKDFEVCYLPAGSFLTAPRKGIPEGEGRVLAIAGPEPPVLNGMVELDPLHRRLMPGFPQTEYGTSTGARKEIEMVASLFGERVRVLTGNLAVRDNLIRELPKYQTIHLAAHSYLNDRDGSHVGILLRAAQADESLQVLSPEDLVMTKLKADLVVLSGCNTWDIQACRKQGIGFVSALVASGCGGVMASVWNVQDSKAPLLMEQFYRRLLEGAKPAAALRLAKLEMIRRGEEDPFVWAGFVLMGDPPALEAGEEPLGYRKTFFAAGVVAIMAVALFVVWWFSWRQRSSWFDFANNHNES